MSKEDHISQDGEVLENCSNGFFTVQLQNGHKVRAHICGKMRTRNRILVIVGDKVKLEISPYDPNNARIIYRYTLKQS